MVGKKINVNKSFNEINKFQCCYCLSWMGLMIVFVTNVCTDKCFIIDYIHLFYFLNNYV